MQTAAVLKTKNINMKNLGIILIAIGIVLMLITGFNFVTKDKVVDLGKVEISKQRNHPVSWSPIVGVVLLAAGVVVLVSGRKKAL
jgi:uncharacterized membrane protein YidH (DUF202 family)